MNPIIRNILAFIAGIVAGGAINMGIIVLGPSIILPPDGVNPADMESLKDNMHLFQPQHFISPFLAHAVGTFAGGLIAALLATSHKMKIALGISVIFLAGGIANVLMLPSPMWFNILDLGGAYLPMGWLAGRIAERK